MAGSEYFDQAAVTWDLEDRRVALARAVAAAIRRTIALSAEMDVLDFGCGTGLVTLELAPLVGSIAGADASKGMLRTLAEKAGARDLAVRLVNLAEEGVPALGGPYHLITSSMTLHHIADVPGLLGHFHHALRPGGQVALADLDTEDGSFHETPSGVQHQGFDRADVAGWLALAGFQEIKLATAAATTKAGTTYTVFLASARKP